MAEFSDHEQQLLDELGLKADRLCIVKGTLDNEQPVSILGIMSGAANNHRISLKAIVLDEKLFKRLTPPEGLEVSDAEK